MPAHKYDPASVSDRKTLAAALKAVLAKGGLTPDAARSEREEEVWMRRASDKITLAVFTSIEGGAVREKAADAIRVVLFYRRDDGQRRTLVDAKRVHRVGAIDDIVARVRARCVEVWEAGKRPPRCKRCSAPLVMSKNERLVCIEACWARGGAGGGEK